MLDIKKLRNKRRLTGKDRGSLSLALRSMHNAHYNNMEDHYKFTEEELLHEQEIQDLIYNSLEKEFEPTEKDIDDIQDYSLMQSWLEEHFNLLRTQYIQAYYRLASLIEAVLEINIALKTEKELDQVNKPVKEKVMEYMEYMTLDHYKDNATSLVGFNVKKSRNLFISSFYRVKAFIYLLAILADCFKLDEIMYFRFKISKLQPMIDMYNEAMEELFQLTQDNKERSELAHELFQPLNLEEDLPVSRKDMEIVIKDLYKEKFGVFFSPDLDPYQNMCFYNKTKADQELKARKKEDNPKTRAEKKRAEIAERVISNHYL